MHVERFLPIKLNKGSDEGRGSETLLIVMPFLNLIFVGSTLRCVIFIPFSVVGLNLLIYQVAESRGHGDISPENSAE